MKLKTLAGSLMLLGLASHALAQGADQRITITGSSIKRIQAEGALPVQVITRAELDRSGIQSAEQLIANISSNGNGLDNLASNADVVTGQSRGNNGATSANLRGQGSNATLILLNGRRVAAHGLNGGVVDLNQIPFAAVERVEVLKDGASSTYGTDAVGGVINFILRSNYNGLEVNAKADVTQHKGGNIFSASMVGGLGNLDSDGYNLLGVVSVQDNKRLDGRQRDFVNTFQPERGLSPDTRGTPFATLQTPNNTNTIRNVLTRPGQASLGVGPLRSGVTLNGINTLDLPGGAGCASQPDMGPYDEGIWAAGAGAQYGCAYDTGKAAVIQQPVKNTSFVGRGAFKLGQHTLSSEVLLGRSESDKVFSENQISSGTATASLLLPDGITSVPSPFRNLRYPSTGAGYQRVFNQLVAAFPELAANAGQPMLFRWRCMVCGPREIATQTDTGRFLVGLDGPLPFLQGWDYRTGISRATSKSGSTLGGGYHYMQKFADLINNGTLNPFLLAGESQSAAAVAGLEAASARGVTLYDGKFTVDEVDLTATGPLYKLPAGEVLAAVGVDYRSEKYKFDGNNTVNQTADTWVFNAPLDNINALAGVKRDVKAVFAEVLFPITKGLELTLSGRHDRYDGFGSTNNPKVSMRWAPAESLVLRASYNTGFRVPTFNQLYNGITVSPNTAAGVVDPERCPSGVVNTTPGNPCNAITFDTAFGGKRDLGPEKAKMANIGIVWQPVDAFSASLDWWTIRREGTIQTLSTSTFFANYNLFRNRFFRDANGNIGLVDIRYINAGETRTQGLELSMKATTTAMGARWTAGLDGTYLIEKKSRLLVSTPFGASEIGLFKRSDDLALRWKHSLYGTYQRGDWTGTLTQVYSTGYAGYIPPGVLSGAVKPAAWDPLVKPYVLHHVTMSYSGFKNLTLSAGIKNLFDRDPPFANSYDTNTGSGSSWEPRVADPRGRSYLVGMQYKFF